MITKGIILELPKQNSNKFKIKIPIFSTTAITANVPDLDASIVYGTLCYQPGNFSGYNVGDVVFVTFEDNINDKPIILGKLYLSTSINDPSSYMQPSILNVTNKAYLPKNTTFDNITFEYLLGMIKKVENLSDIVVKLQNEIDALKQNK